MTTRTEKRMAILNHIKEYYPSFDELKRDVQSASYHNELDRSGTLNLAAGERFLADYSDVKQFMRSCGYDGRLSQEHMWILYVLEISTVIMTAIKTNIY